MKKTWFLAIKSQFSLQMWAKLYYKTNKKAKIVLCSVIKHSRKWRQHSRRREKHSPAARVHPTRLSCSRHFLACFITEPSTVLAFLFVKYYIILYSAIILRGRAGYHMIDNLNETRSAELVIIIWYPASPSRIIVLLKTQSLIIIKTRKREKKESEKIDKREQQSIRSHD